MSIQEKSWRQMSHTDVERFSTTPVKSSLSDDMLVMIDLYDLELFCFVVLFFCIVCSSLGSVKKKNEQRISEKRHIVNTVKPILPLLQFLRAGPPSSSRQRAPLDKRSVLSILSGSTRILKVYYISPGRRRSKEACCVKRAPPPPYASWHHPSEFFPQSMFLGAVCCFWRYLQAADWQVNIYEPINFCSPEDIGRLFF